MRIEKEKGKSPVIYDAINPIGFDTPKGVFFIVKREYGFDIIQDTKVIFTTKGFIKYGKEEWKHIIITGY